MEDIENYLLDLFERKNDSSYVKLPDGSSTSVGSISTLAYAEAREYNNIDAIEPLKKILSKQKKVWIRYHAYQILIRYIKIFSKEELLDFIFERLKTENSTYILSIVLKNILELDSFPQFNTYKSQIENYSLLKDFAIKSDATRILEKYDLLRPKRKYAVVMYAKGIKALYKNKPPLQIQDIPIEFIISLEERIRIKESLIRYKYNVTNETSEAVELNHSRLEENFCIIEDKKISFFTTKLLEQNAIFEVLQTPCEIANKKFDVFCISDGKWLKTL
jgi:hypothetical protein